jgi:hypothetical protein
MIHSCALIYFGALAGHMLSTYNPQFKGTRPFISANLPGRSDTFYSRIDTMLLPVLGTFLAYYLIVPQDGRAQLISGLTWSGTLVALLQIRRGSDSDQPGKAPDNNKALDNNNSAQQSS